MDQLTTQALDMIFENDTLKDKMRQKVGPYVLGGVIFNLILLALLVFILVKLSYIQGAIQLPRLP
jgi:hypothetical protein